MDLNIIWFILIGVLFAGFFFLEGFDYGVGILLPFLGKNDVERRTVINSIGPVWDGNEVWMITAGGAMFAAFPHWYATLFSGFYLALVLMLFGLILRGVSFEFRSKVECPKWRALWDTCIFLGSIIPSLLWGVAIMNLLRGVPIDETMTYTGGFFNLLNIPALMGGVAAILLFATHGAVFLSLKTDGEIRSRAEAAAFKLWILTTLGVVAFLVIGQLSWGVFSMMATKSLIPALLALVLFLVGGAMLKGKSFGKAFICIALAIASATAMVFLYLFPNVMISSTDPGNNLTIYTAASTPHTLRLMFIVAVCCVPLVLLYQAWTYWVFRQRVNPEHLEY